MNANPVAGSSALIVIIPAVITLAGTLATLIAARASARRASATETIKLGVTQLVDQLQEELGRSHREMEECRGECAALRVEVGRLRDRVEQQTGTIEDQQAEIIRLMRKAGEL